MKTRNRQHKHNLFISVVTLLLCSQAIAFAQSTQVVPENLRGYWQFKTNNITDWNGPVIGETFVEFFYKIKYTEEIEKKEDGSYLFTLRGSDGEKSTFRMSEISADSATLQYIGWKTPIRCYKRSIPDHTESIDPTALPAHLYQKWTTGLTGNVACELTRDGKMQYGGKTWEILFAGYYLNKEYRLLAKNGDLYELFYLTFPIPGTLQIVSELKKELLLPMAANPEVYVVAGCWVNKTTGDWTIGFFENFAVYQSKFWDYESIKTNKDKCTVVLKSGKERLAIQTKRKDGNNCTITFGKSKPQEHTLCSSRYLPDYPQTDHTSFVDNGYTTDSVTIIGYFRNLPSTKPFEVVIPDMIKDKDIEFKSEIDSLGRFTLRFPVLNSHEVFIDWGRATISTSVEPGKTYFLFTDFSTGQKLFMGKDVRFQNERLAYRELGVYIPYKEGKKMSNLDFFHQTLKNYQLEKNKLDTYISTHPNLSQRFRYYSEQALRYKAGRDLMQRRFDVDSSNKEELDKEFMDYVDSAFVPNPVQPYTLARDYTTFIIDYMKYIDNISPHSPKENVLSTESIKKSLEKLERNGKITLTKEDRNDLDEWEKMFQKMMGLLATRPDSLTLANFQKPYEPLLERIDKLQSSDAWNEYIRSFPNISSFDSQLITIDSLPADTPLKEILTAQLFYNTLGNSHTALSDSLLSRLKTLVANPSLINYVQQQQDIYISIAKEAVAHLESLKSNEPLAGITDGKELLEKIIEPYKGKVIYLDVWGTWCGPCKAMLQFAGNTKKLFEGKDVIFLYLANNSPDLSWKNIIKEYGLTGSVSAHYNLPDNQQRAIEQFLGVSYFPTYVLIDKEGNVANTKAPRPDQESELVNAVWNELNKK